MKKSMRILVTLCMVMAMFLGLSVMAMAEGDDGSDLETTPKPAAVSAEIKTLPIAAIGEDIADAKVEFTSEAAGWTLETVWTVWDAVSDSYVAVGADEKFEDGKVYRLCTKATLQQGYVEDEENGFKFVFTDELEDEFGTVPSSWTTEGTGVWECEIRKIPFTKEIDRIDIGLPEVKAGNLMGLDSMTLYIGDEKVENAGGDFPLIFVDWIFVWEENDGDVDVSGGYFADGNTYQFAWGAELEQGYSFDDNIKVYINGEPADYVQGGTDDILVFKSYNNLVPAIEKVEITGLPTVTPGAKITSDSIKMAKEIEDVELDEIWWYELDEDGYEVDVEDATFAAGKTYYLRLNINTSGDAPLSDDFIFVVDGKEYKATEIYDDNAQAYLILKYEVKEATNDTNNNTDNNTNNSTDNAPSTPKTGDISMVMLWAVLAMAGAAGVVFVQKRRGN